MGGRLDRDGQTAALDGVVLVNNTWGRGELVRGRDYAQSVTYGDSLADGVRFDWRWPDAAEGVRAYPEMFAGRKPWGPETGGDLLPLPADAAQGLTLSYDLAWGGETAGFNVALDLWIADGPGAGPEGIAQEVMVWLKPGAFSPAGAPAARLEIGGLSGPLYVREGHGAGWTYLAFVPDQAPAEGSVDIGALLSALSARGHVARDSHLLTVELGAEVVQGAGWLEVKAFALSAPPATPGDGADGATRATPSPQRDAAQGVAEIGQPTPTPVPDMAFGPLDLAL